MAKKPSKDTRPTSFSDERTIKITGGTEQSAPVYVLNRNSERVHVGTAKIIKGMVQGEHRDTTIGARYYDRTTKSLPNFLEGMQGRASQTSFAVKATRSDGPDWYFQQPSDIQQVLLDVGFQPLPEMLHYQRGGLELMQHFIVPDVMLPDMVGDYDVKYWAQKLAAAGKAQEMALSPMLTLSYGIEADVAMTATVGWWRWVCTNGSKRFMRYGGYKSGHLEFDFDHFMRWADRIRQGMSSGDFTSNILDDGFVKPGDVIVDPKPNKDMNNLREIIMGKLQIPTAAALCDAATILRASSYRVPNGKKNNKQTYLPLCHSSFHAPVLTEEQEVMVSAIGGTLDVNEARSAATQIMMLCESLPEGEGVYTGQIENAISSHLTHTRMSAASGGKPMVEAQHNARAIASTVRKLGQIVWSPLYIESLKMQMADADAEDK